MSYIRSTSNPEGLYIFTNIDSLVEIHKGPEKIGNIPEYLFNELIDKYIESRSESVYVTSHICNQKLMIYDIFIEEEEDYNKLKCGMRLEYQDVFKLDMWDVTWEYIARTNYGRSKPKWKRKLIKRICKI